MIPDIVIAPVTIIAFVLCNVVTYLMMAWDKFCALTNRWRVPERTLLSFALFGGAVGAKAAQFMCRHKTRKQPFARALNLCLGLNVVVVCAAMYAQVAG